MTTPAARSLTPQEVDAFLRTPVVARLATVRPDGAPYVVPVWQHWDGRALYVIPRAKSRFVDYVRHEPRVALSCADDVDPAHTRVLVEGKAEILEGPVVMAGQMLDIANEMARRYMGPDGPTYLARTARRPRYLIRIVPARITSWRGGEWHPRYVAG
ncbi:MAG: pyridoxamine 5'-phosphate oxidase family protein [Chloroflexi bacterium]|nr:pyridoxamine 5'-phosphate oxidase family protein [Chloroflexota bacterium]